MLRKTNASTNLNEGCFERMPPTQPPLQSPYISSGNKTLVSSHDVALQLTVCH